MVVSEDDEEIPIIRGNFENLTRRPVENDYGLVIFKALNIDMYYVAKLIEVDDEDNYGVSFMWLLNKENIISVDFLILKTDCTFTIICNILLTVKVK